MPKLQKTKDVMQKIETQLKNNGVGLLNRVVTREYKRGELSFDLSVYIRHQMLLFLMSRQH